MRIVFSLLRATHFIVSRVNLWRSLHGGKPNGYGQTYRTVIMTDLALATASSLAETIPNANSLTNANFTCGESRGESEPGSSASSSNSLESSPCSEGSLCLEGDLGVYCQCYVQRSTSEQVTRGKILIEMSFVYASFALEPHVGRGSTQKLCGIRYCKG